MVAACSNSDACRCPCVGVCRNIKANVSCSSVERGYWPSCPAKSSLHFPIDRLKDFSSFKSNSRPWALRSLSTSKHTRHGPRSCPASSSAQSAIARLWIPKHWRSSQGKACGPSSAPCTYWTTAATWSTPSRSRQLPPSCISADQKAWVCLLLVHSYRVFAADRSFIHFDPLRTRSTRSGSCVPCTKSAGSPSTRTSSSAAPTLPLPRRKS
ncbi:hypothetical protein B5M09_005216 [Aphanomyces astaci]|uniref:Uncharacterized protein n=1 Tax=Aphanomyces astaci TaxID=112090 RepID=A0A3R7Y8R9_APHAT|nr:hypothetical protein B5M09_005216 [Aphanomyces astaci]